MKTLVVLVCVVVAVSASAFSVLDGMNDLIPEEWRTFKLQHKKSFTSEVEDAFRMRIFAENKLFIAQHNQRFLQGRVSYKVKLNMFADMLYDEFLHTMYGFNTTNIDNNSSEDSLSAGSSARSKRATYPSQVDWRDKGAVTAVKNQGSCGSCWAFSATGAMEGQNFIKNKKLVALSEQNLIDCSSAYGNKGCKGGFMTNAYNYVKDNGGIDSESSYPYQGSDQTCRYKSENSAMKGTGFVNLARGDEEKLMQAVATVGPISVAIDAGQKGFQFYADGVYYDKNCSSTSVNHGVLVVGYGSDYWLVKNSWGTSWGQSGYIKMARNKNNHCAIANWGCYPLL